MDKVIITNFDALTAKYRSSGLSKIKSALKKLIAADKKRGLETIVVALDNAAQMKKLNAPVVTDPKSERQNKRAVDAINKALAPSYIMLLGSIDVIPHQSLANPVFDGDQDPDRFAYSDIPYACEGAYSNQPMKFVGPTRVVGRLPDITGAKDPAYLLDILTTATEWKSRPRSDYANYLGISAHVWEDSTALSLENTFGSSDDMQSSPDQGPRWIKSLLGRRSHFINCHGAIADPNFYGQKGDDYPTAHEANHIRTKAVSEGTVVAAECCYGAELYDPLKTGGRLGICNTYLSKKAYGFLGSSTIAYGPAQGNGSADLICQYFLKHILAGASLGRAVLLARQEFARQAGGLDPIDLKTLVQFNLMGDPSIQPVEAATPHVNVGTTGKRGARRTGKSRNGMLAMNAEEDQDEVLEGVVKEGDVAPAFMRQQRRRQLVADGLLLSQSVAVAQKVKGSGNKEGAGLMLDNLIAANKLTNANVLSYVMETPSLKGSLAKANAFTGRDSAMKIHVVLGQTEGTAESKVANAKALVVWEKDGRVISYREVEQH